MTPTTVYTLKPLDLLRPRARSNFLPLDSTYGFCSTGQRLVDPRITPIPAGIAYLVRVGTEAEVLDGLTGVLGAAEEKGVGASGGAESELVQSQGLATSLENPGTGSGGEAQSGDGELGDLKQAVVVGDGANNDDGLALVSLARVLVRSGRDDAGDGHRRTVDARHEKAAEHDLVEVRIGTACVIGLLESLFLCSLLPSCRGLVGSKSGLFSRSRGFTYGQGTEIGIHVSFLVPSVWGKGITHAIELRQ